jgi:hypothetical protein
LLVLACLYWLACIGLLVLACLYWLACGPSV